MEKVTIFKDMFLPKDVVYVIDADRRVNVSTCKTCDGSSSLKVEKMDLYVECPECVRGSVSETTYISKVVKVTVAESNICQYHYSDTVSTNVSYQIDNEYMPEAFYFHDIFENQLFESKSQAMEVLRNEELLKKYKEDFWNFEYR